ncbi:hypothetical protein L6452_15698 [Arctium lappa]|uniref:Uncharacterized protein n=1 Tax=Arctium lappa TaxID=4217 RepID=A0ACB9CPD9_ARCLA|nr:hypothetical protein L6452_15698 [Arctium lappa]
MITVHLPLITPSLTKSPALITSIRSFRSNPIIQSTSLRSCRDSRFKLCCIPNDISNHKPSQDFSILKTDFQCDSGTTWSTMAFYVFSLHIPLSFGGLSVVAQLLHQNALDPEIQALSLLLLQTLELVAFILLLGFSEKPFNILSFFEARVLPKERNWLLASVLGLCFLLALVFLTSAVADKLIGPKDVNNPILKEILSGGSLSVIGSTLVYCFVTPLLEETVYRGFLLTSLASRMEWQKAVMTNKLGDDVHGRDFLS